MDQPDTEMNHVLELGTIQCLGTNEHELVLAMGCKCPEQEPRAEGATHLFLSSSPWGQVT